MYIVDCGDSYFLYSLFYVPNMQKSLKLKFLITCTVLTPLAPLAPLSLATFKGEQLSRWG